MFKPLMIFALVLVCQFLLISAAPFEEPIESPVQYGDNLGAEFPAENAEFIPQVGGTGSEVMVEGAPAVDGEGVETDDRFGLLGGLHGPFGHHHHHHGLGMGGMGGYGGYGGYGDYPGGFGGGMYPPFMG